MSTQGALRPVATALLALVAVATMGCGSQAKPEPSAPAGQAVKITILSSDGPLGIGPPNLVAARSVPELEALLQATSSVRFRNPDGWKAFAGRPDRVFVAISVGFCVHLASVTAARDNSGTVFVSEHIEGKCAPGAGAAALPGVYLAEIPRSELGTGVVTLRAIGAPGRARVDLRAPAVDADAASVMSEARQAITAARGMIQLDQPAVHELDMMRWPDETLACQPSAEASSSLPIAGYIVALATSTDVDPRPEEFAWAGGKLVDCGPAPGA